MTPDPVEMRNLVLHGWERQGHTPGRMAMLKMYHKTGLPEFLAGTRYEQIRNGIIKARER
jgi:hypothetical protein